MPAGEGNEEEGSFVLCPPHLSGVSSGHWDPLPAVRGCPCPPQPSEGLSSICSQAGKPGPASPARIRVAAGSVPLRPPPPAVFDLSAAVLGEQRRLRGFAAWSPGAGSPPQPLQLGGEKLYFHLHLSIPLPALELFLEPKGRKGRGLPFLPPLCSCPFIPLFPAAANGFASERTHLSVPLPFHLALSKYRGRAALVGERGGKSAFVGAGAWAGELRSFPPADGEASCLHRGPHRKPGREMPCPATASGPGEGDAGAQQVLGVHLEMMERHLGTTVRQPGPGQACPASLG